MRGLRVLAVVIVVGCGGDDGVSIDTNKDNVCSEIAEVGCHNMYQCCSEGEIEDYLNVGDPRSEAQCREDLTKLCERNIATLSDAIAKERVTFDSDVMNDCLNALVAPSGTCATVDTMTPWADSCMQSAWVGAVAVGGTCLSAYECAGADSYCGPDKTCQALPTENQSCSAYGCATGLYCDGAVCKRRLAQGAMCTSTIQCDKDLFCDTSLATPVCAALKNAGERCTGDSACKNGDCLPGTCSNSTSSCYDDSDCYGRCENNGDYCIDDSYCGYGTCSNDSTITCASDASCGTGNTCVFTYHCITGTCGGDIVCAADQTQVVDYCTDALGALPLP